jgi:alpha-N-arabinofuranosidase
MHLTAKAELQLPTAEKISVGIAAFQSEAAHYYFGVQRTGKSYQVFVEQTHKSAPKIIASIGIPKATLGKNIVLSITGNSGKISFSYYSRTGEPVTILKDADASLLSTEVAGGFVGTYLGMHARTE